MISEEEKLAVVKMFCAYCRKTLRNARTDTVLADAIHGLSKGDQAIVLLYYFAEWTDRRIAEELGCPRSTVQFRRSKALLALRARLEEVIGDDEL